jgi:hypothetical protein
MYSVVGLSSEYTRSSPDQIHSSSFFKSANFGIDRCMGYLCIVSGEGCGFWGLDGG